MAAPRTNLTVKDAQLAHALVAKHNNDEDNVVRSTHHPDCQLLERLATQLSPANRLFYPAGVAEDKSLLCAIRISVWTLHGVILTRDELFDATSTQQYQNEVALWQQRPRSPLIDQATWYRDDFHHPYAAATILSSLQKLPPVRLVICKAQGPVANGITDHELDVYDSLHSNDNSPIIWVHATSPPDGGNDVKYAGLVDKTTFTRRILNLNEVAADPDAPSTLDHWWAPKSGEEPNRPQGFADLPDYWELLQEMGIWPSEDNDRTRGDSLGWRFYTPTQMADKYSDPSVHRTMIWHRVEAALKFYFGDAIAAAFKTQWNAHSGESTTWGPARELRRLLEFPRW